MPLHMQIPKQVKDELLFIQNQSQQLDRQLKIMSAKDPGHQALYEELQGHAKLFYANRSDKSNLASYCASVCSAVNQIKYDARALMQGGARQVLGLRPDYELLNDQLDEIKRSATAATEILTAQSYMPVDLQLVDVQKILPAKKQEQILDEQIDKIIHEKPGSRRVEDRSPELLGMKQKIKFDDFEVSMIELKQTVKQLENRVQRQENEVMIERRMRQDQENDMLLKITQLNEQVSALKAENQYIKEELIGIQQIRDGEFEKWKLIIDDDKSQKDKSQKVE